MTNPTLNPWDRQPGEPTPAFHAFTVYRDLGYRRSLSRVASDLIGTGRRSGTPKTVRQHIGLWSAKHKWVERCAAWDHELDRQRQLDEQRQRREMRERQASLAEAFQQTLSIPVRAMLDKLQTNPDLIAELSASDTAGLLNLSAQAARALPAVVAVEREARGMDVDVSVLPAPVPVDRPAEEDRLRRVAAIMGQHGLLPPAPAAAAPSPILMPASQETPSQAPENGGSP